VIGFELVGKAIVSLFGTCRLLFWLFGPTGHPILLVFYLVMGRALDVMETGLIWRMLWDTVLQDERGHMGLSRGMLLQVHVHPHIVLGVPCHLYSLEYNLLVGRARFTESSDGTLKAPA
jgi:hypothetical protein